jgi:RNA polymerase sigma-70 factor, ECF subfamily
MVGSAPVREARSTPTGRAAEPPLAPGGPSRDRQTVALDFERVYSDNFDFVWRAVRALGIPAGSVDDVTQDVFLVVHRKLDSLESSASLRSWLFGIARRVCKDHRRAAGRRGPHLELDAQREIDAGQDPQRAALNRQELEVVERYADGLDDERRALFALALVEGLSIADVAATLGLNPNTTYSRVRVMRQELAELLDAETRSVRGNDGAA